MGKVVVRRAQSQGHETLIVDPKSAVQQDPTEAIAWSTVIYLSLFPRDLLEVLDKYGHRINVDQIVLENASVKRRIIPALMELDSQGISVCATHPLARYNQPSRGQKALVLEVGNNSERAKIFAEEFYRNQGMITIHYPLAKHDEMMLKEQLLPHLVMRSVGRTFEKLGVNPQEMWDLAPANAELFQSSAWRTLIQDPRISANILHSYLEDEDGQQVAKTLTSSLEEIIAASGDEERLASFFQKTFENLNTGDFAQNMEEKTTIILERAANLRIQSLTVLSKEDKPGILHTVTGIFAQCGINLTALDSHVLDIGVKFMIGEDPQTETNTLEQAKLRLRESGFEIQEIQKS